jgi:DNA-3-methyladenine glycosylase II
MRTGKRPRMVTEDSSREVWLRKARSYLRNADPVLARLIDGRPDFDLSEARTLRDLAGRLSDGRVDPKVLSSLPDEEIMAELTAIPGIGPWTVQGALLLALGREDVVVPSDLRVRKAIQCPLTRQAPNGWM